MDVSLHVYGSGQHHLRGLHMYTCLFTSPGLRLDVGNRPEHFAGRAGFKLGQKKTRLFSAKKCPVHDRPIRRVGPIFSGLARAGPGPGRPTRALCNVKQLKYIFRAGLGPSNFFLGSKISAHALSSKVRGRAKTRRARTGPVGWAGLDLLRSSWQWNWVMVHIVINHP